MLNRLDGWRLAGWQAVAAPLGLPGRAGDDDNYGGYNSDVSNEPAAWGHNGAGGGGAGSSGAAGASVLTDTDAGARSGHSQSLEALEAEERALEEEFNVDDQE